MCIRDRRIARHSRRQVDGYRGARSEDLREPKVAVCEARVFALLVMSDDDPDRSSAGEQRDVEAGTCVYGTRRMLIDLGIVRERVHAFGTSTLEHAAALGSGSLEAQTKELVCAGAVGRFDAQRPLGDGQCDRHYTRSDQAAQTQADELQEARQLDLRG